MNVGYGIRAQWLENYQKINKRTHGRLSHTIILSSQNKNFLLKTIFPDYLGQNHHKKSNCEKFYAFFDPA